MNTYDFIVRFCLCVCIVTIIYVAFVWPAKADVRAACQSDYLTHCSHTEPFSKPCRACMRAVGRKRLLSAECVSALKAAGEVTQADVKAARR